MGPEQLKLRELVDRAKTKAVKELIIATNPDPEGEATAAYLRMQLKDFIPTITRIAHGLPMGADIEFADQVTLSESLQGRRTL
jgi:recombination protein RecR